MSGTHQHPYHLVEPSPWPLVGSISGLITAIGAIMFMHERDFGIFVLYIFLYGKCYHKIRASCAYYLF